jgi:plasmid replication initiation protein
VERYTRTKENGPRRKRKVTMPLYHRHFYVRKGTPNEMLRELHYRLDKWEEYLKFLIKKRETVKFTLHNIEKCRDSLMRFTYIAEIMDKLPGEV